jgi:N utilization substance protein A
MMNKEILTVVDVVSNEKGVAKEVIFEALEAALASATKKRFTDEVDVRVAIDRATGDYEAFRRWEVMDRATRYAELELVNEGDEPDLEFPERQIFFEEASAKQPGIQVGDFIEEPLEAAEFGRIAAQRPSRSSCRRCARPSARRSSTSTRARRHAGLGRRQARRPQRHLRGSGRQRRRLHPRRRHDPARVVRRRTASRRILKEVRTEPRGPQLFLSRRTAPEFLIELFKLEVPEVGQGLIRSWRRPRVTPGVRAKIAVRSNDPRIDPGRRLRRHARFARAGRLERDRRRARRHHPVRREPAQFVINAMSPAEVVSIVVDEDSQHGRRGDGREAVAGHRSRRPEHPPREPAHGLGTERDDGAGRRAEERDRGDLVENFMKQLDVDEESRDPGAGRLLDHRGNRLRAQHELAAIEEFDEDDDQGTAQPRARRAADAGHRERGELDPRCRPTTCSRWTA